ncbi:hypothetical protein [Serratia fonticola]
MAVTFFVSEDVQIKIKDLLGVIEATESNGDFEKERNQYIVSLLKTFLSEPNKWDEGAPFNIVAIGERFINTNLSLDFSKDKIDEFYAGCFRFFIERYIRLGERLNPAFENCNQFSAENKSNFSSIASTQISYALITMPLDIFRENIKKDDVSLLKEFIKTHEDCKTLKSGWDSDFSKRMLEIKELKDALNEQKNAYNFVGLYNGFDRLSEGKKNEMRNALILLWALGALIIAPIAFEIYYINSKPDTASLTHTLLTMIPAFSLVFILIYYFRIALHNYKSINIQISQIELRKSLCMFIQNYSDYAQKIKEKDKSALEKFEAIIFSNIAMSDEKLPSTFDGLEPIANLIKSMKNQ